ncbi:hypothetical protein Nepgr_019880 [Nepenthes gracilis]|uniref:Uncharacterized protein n=1 Tax=Nepenthes gracilis TaxID=150966 RepID=A0AAD3SVZ0_NEPGR|nr:hypothetical protein Nepgr_019880 [Nepenthes gracilis]
MFGDTRTGNERSGSSRKSKKIGSDSEKPNKQPQRDEIGRYGECKHYICSTTAMDLMPNYRRRVNLFEPMGSSSRNSESNDIQELDLELRL